MAYRKTKISNGRSPENHVQPVQARHEQGDARVCIIDNSQFCIPTSSCFDCPNRTILKDGTPTNWIPVDALTASIVH